MLRRRGLSGFFKFGIKGPSDTKYTDSTSLTFPYGIEKNITIWELGTVIGNNVGYPTFTEDGKEKTYCVLSSRGKGLENIAFLNFTTYEEQDVVIKIKDICDNENDFLAVCHLDATDKDHIYSMISGNSSKTVTFTNVAPGPHFVKIYYYQHNDSDDVYPSTPVHGSTHAGYFRLEPWTHIYDKGYSKPATQTVKIKSYYGWDLVSKPEWVSLNMEYAKSGSKSLKITLNGNHSVERTGSIVLRERKNNTDITINITQGANDEPNDILLSYEGGGTTADGNSVTNIKVKVKGDTTYSVSNPNNTEYSISYPTPVAITDEQNEDGAYADMSVRESTLTITKKKTGNVNPVTFRIYTPSVSKDVVINSDKISCYCDCNQYNRCQCDIETRNYKQEFSDCPAWSYNCSVHNANASNCDSHCSANENYTECSGHNTCECNSQCANQCNCYSKLIQTGSYCYPDTLNSCGSKCPANGCSYSLNSCGSQCGANGCNSNTLDTCSGHYNYCSPDRNDTCSGKCESNGCNSNVYSCSSEWHGNFYIDLILTNQALRDTKFEAVYIEMKLQNVQVPVTDGHGKQVGVNGGGTAYMTIYYEYSINETSSPKRLYLPYCMLGSIITDLRVWATPSSNTRTLYSYSTITYNQRVGSNTNRIWYQTLVSIELSSIGSWTGYGSNDLSGCMSVGCECNGNNSICMCHGNNSCGSQSYYCSPDTLNSCGSQCGSNGCNYSLNSCGSKSTYCTSNTNDTCSGHYNYCSPDKNDTCSGKCPSNGCYYSACNDGCSDGCPGKRSDCTCYTKLYYPYCKCVGFCECYNYDIPTICDAHNCKADEINSCTCNSQVTCASNSLY